MKIVFATDGSAYATQAAHVLRNLQIVEPVSLTVLTAGTQLDHQYRASMAPWFDDWQEMEAKRIHAHHHELSDLLQSIDGEIHMELREGAPAHEIISYAEQVDADLIVMGARGHSAIGRLVLGSVSDAVATQAKCSVLVVRPGQQSSDDMSVIEPLRWTLAYDQSNGSKAAAAELARLEWSSKSELEIVSVIPVLKFYAQEYATQYKQIVETEADAARAASEKLISLFASRVPNLNSQLAKGEHIGETIIQQADQFGSNIIALGDTRRGLIGRLALGSTANYVLRHATQSVWISRMADKTAEELLASMAQGALAL